MYTKYHTHLITHYNQFGATLRPAKLAVGGILVKAETITHATILEFSGRAKGHFNSYLLKHILNASTSLI